MDTVAPSLQTTDVLPLLGHRPGATIAWRRGRRVSRETFLHQAQQLANGLPASRFAANLCSDRYLFTLAFAAAICRGQTSLLPSSRVPHEIASTLRAYPESYEITDDDVRSLLNDGDGPDARVDPLVPNIDGDRVVAITFTSGSSGIPQANEKTWRSLVHCAKLTSSRFAVGGNTAIVATVPPQHMYGLETSVMLPLAGAASVDAGRPFFPQDILDTLVSVQGNRMLVTTPAHLRVCVESNIEWPPLNTVLSATAPLTEALAASSERAFAAPVMEIYGCTEGGSLASRRTLDGTRWHSLDGVEIGSDGDASYACGGHLPARVALQDVVEPLGTGSFRLLGRQEDMVIIAGKRASLANLSHHLNNIDGVVDGVFVLPEPGAGGEPQRLAALVVAPHMDTRRVLAGLTQRIDAAFLPRPLHRVDSLPRNETGKLPRRALLALLASLQQG